nr:hypothetical protein [Angustibacter aerolatus]
MTSRRRPAARHGRLRGAREGLHAAAPRRAGGACAAPTPASATPRRSST